MTLLHKHIGKHLTLGLVASALSAAALPNARAALIPNNAVDQNYLDLGASFAGKVLALRQVAPNGQWGWASVTYINEKYAITSAHLVKNTLAAGYSFQVGTGTDVYNPTTLTNIKNVLIHPNYSGDGKNSPDIAILEFDTPMAGTAAQIGTVSNDQKTTSAGFGFTAKPDGSISFADGHLRAWEANTINSSVWHPSLYQSTSFGISMEGITLNGKSLNGDSGGGVFFGNTLVGLNTGQIGNGDTTGASVFLSLGKGEVAEWISTNTVIPEPTIIGMAAIGSLALLRRRRLS